MSQPGNEAEPDSGFHVVIPARYGSSRFPGKPLHPLLGKPMILHVIARAQASAAQEIIVATDDERIAAVCEGSGAEVVMTKADHASGTDRIAEVAQKKQWVDTVRIVGLQGDEPAMPSEHIDLLAENLLAHPTASMATLSFPAQTMEDWHNPDRVKVVTDHQGMALYFSRAPIPHCRDDNATVEQNFTRTQGSAAGLSEGRGKGRGEGHGERMAKVPAEVQIHVGMYAYRARFLSEYAKLPASRLEALEQLEQLRVLEAGHQIHVGEISTAVAHGVDRLDDVASMEQLLNKQGS